MRIKICGIKNTDEANIMNEFMPDFIGFIFAKSKREISFENALDIKNILSSKIQTVGVFVDKTTDEILNYKNIINYAQLHGEYSEKDIENLKNNGIKTIKVIKAKNNNVEIQTLADYALIDTFSETAAGGTGKNFDWNIEIKSNVPYFIAGGINENNIKEAIEKLNPNGIDISSGVEVNGFKTKEKVSNIIEIVRGINT